jgi:hypothetical protein
VTPGLSADFESRLSKAEPGQVTQRIAARLHAAYPHLPWPSAHNITFEMLAAPLAIPLLWGIANVLVINSRRTFTERLMKGNRWLMILAALLLTAGEVLLFRIDVTAVPQMQANAPAVANVGSGTPSPGG